MESGRKRDIGDRELKRFCRGAKSLWNIDVASYGRRQLIRRLGNMVDKNDAKSLLHLLRKMQKDPQLAERLRYQFTINVSEFFRDLHLFEALESVLRRHLQQHTVKKAWSAGCSYGAEPYTLAILLDELGLQDAQIIATDIDDEALGRAKTGVYMQSDLEHVSAKRLRKYFDDIRPGEYRLCERLRKRVTFRKLDLLDPGNRRPRKCDLILCRNVIIYFQAEAKRRVHQLLAECLNEDGLLFIGATERVSEAQKLGLNSISPFIYLREAA